MNFISVCLCFHEVPTLLNLLTYLLTHSLTYLLTDLLTYSLTPWSRVLPEKLSGFN